MINLNSGLMLIQFKSCIYKNMLVYKKKENVWNANRFLHSLDWTRVF